MIDVNEVQSKAGLWLEFREDSIQIIGAHIAPQEAQESGRLTIIWAGQPESSSLVSFCQRAFRQLDMHDQGTMSFLGRVLASGEEARFNGSRWQIAGNVSGAQLLRFECVATPTSKYTVSLQPSETIIVWAAFRESASPPHASEKEWDEDENIGVHLQLARVTTLEKELSMLIAESHQNSIKVDLVREALRALVAHLDSRPQAHAAVA